jgi:hypothetical protein
MDYRQPRVATAQCSALMIDLSVTNTPKDNDNNKRQETGEKQLAVDIID